MKKTVSILLACALLCALFAGCGSSKTLTLNVYNWGEYISDGSEGSLDTVKAFEKWYAETYGEKVKVNYTTYASNEDMYAKLSSGAGFQTLPIRIYNMTKKTVTPKMYALATIIFFVILALLLISNLTDESAVEKRKNRKLKRKGLTQ